MIEATIKKVSPIETEVAQPSTVTMELKPLSNGGGSSFSVLFVEQELTDEQKAQARANIGVEDIPEWALEEEKPTYTADEVGAIAQEDLQKAVNIALQQAQASGKFNGEDGVSVVSVRQTTTSSIDGGSNVITVTLSNGQTSTFTVKNGSKGSQGVKGDRGLQGVKGDTGAPGPQGAQGVQGAKGDKGDKGDTGAKGADGTSVTVSSVSESTANGGSNVVTFSDGKRLTVKNGTQGAKGDTGADGKNGADGYTPVKGKDYYTESDKAEMVQAVLAMIPIYDGEVVAE